MTVHNISTGPEFKEAITKHPKVVIEFFDKESETCKRLAPLLVDCSNTDKYEDVMFAKVEVEEMEELAAVFSVQATPTLVLFKNGENVGELVTPDPSELVVFLENAL